MRAAFLQQWKDGWTLDGVFQPMLQPLGMAIALGWIVGRGDNPTAISYLFIGASLYAMWVFGVFRTGWSLAGEHFSGTLDLMITTRTPLFLVMLGKAMAIMAVLAVTGITVFFVILAFSGGFPPVEHVELLVVSAAIAVVTLIATAFVFAPFSFIAGARGGFFNAFMPMGGVLTGFLYPIGLLPRALEIIAHGLPSAWAMQAVIGSIEGGQTSMVLRDWGLALVLSAVFIAAAWALFRVAERRVRVTGNLGRI
jgi:ABC-type multidrug transport system permease subunit